MPRILFERRVTHCTVTDQDVSATQWVRCILESQMPSVTLNALLVYDQSLLRVCPPGRTLGHNIIGVTDIACGHISKRPSGQGEKWISRVNRHSEPEQYKKGLERSDQNRSWLSTDHAGLTFDAHLRLRIRIQQAQSPPVTESSSVLSSCDQLPPSRRHSIELSHSGEAIFFLGIFAASRRRDC